jgi:hypothetical protein
MVFSDSLQPLESIWTGKDYSSVSPKKVRDAKQRFRTEIEDQPFRPDAAPSRRKTEDGQISRKGMDSLEFLGRLLF